MAKKRNIVDLQSKKISYEENGISHELLSLKTSSMTVDIRCSKNGVFIKNSTLPFAHLPKKIKSLINPLK